MIKHIRRVFWLIAAGGMMLVFSSFDFMSLGQNPLAPNLRGQVSKAGTHLENLSQKAQRQLKKVNKATTSLTDIGKDNDTDMDSEGYYIIDGRRYVFLEGRYFPASPNHTYMINGTPTFHMPQPLVKKASAQAESNTSVGQNLPQLPSNPLKVYTPSGMKKLGEDLKAAKQNIEKRNQILKQFE